MNLPLGEAISNVTASAGFAPVSDSWKRLPGVPDGGVTTQLDRRSRRDRQDLPDGQLILAREVVGGDDHGDRDSANFREIAVNVSPGATV